VGDSFPAPDELRVIQVLLNYCIVFFRSRHQAQKFKSRNPGLPHSGARHQTLHSGTQIPKIEGLPQSAICDLASQDAVRVWRSASFPTRSAILIIGCLDPASVMRTVDAADCGHLW
jgi:hypothetical protein